jgi:nitrite reductase/ring-hydroxylating ferredoxin subunit
MGPAHSDENGPAGPTEDPVVAPIIPGLQAPGTNGAPFERVLLVEELPPGAMRRVSVGDLDLLVAHTTAGLLATEDRCPHMSAPLSLGTLDGTAVDCVLHRAVIDLATGAILTFPTTGGLGPDGEALPAWAPPGSEPKPERTDLKARARALTRTRRPRYYPVRLAGGWIEVAVPAPIP